MNLLERASEGFSRTWGQAPQGVAFVPGRVNLIGEHVDYNDGLVLPIPIAAGTAIAWSAIPGDAIEAVALDFGGAGDRFVPGAASPHQPVDWRSYLRGTTEGLSAQGLQIPAARLAIAGSIPRGSGLSSSASLCVAVGRALTSAAGLAANPKSLALAAQHSEHQWAGVRCGIMDQMAVAAGRDGCALLLDCADLTHRNVAIPADWAVMIVQSGVRRGLVDGQYNHRREDCEAAARTLGVPSLRHVDGATLSRADLDPQVMRRARHVVEEIARVERAVEAVEQGDIALLGNLMRDSHASLRDLFEVSHPQVDRLVEVLNGAIGMSGGARMTGGGFGGAVVAVMPRREVERVRAEIEQGYAPPDGAALDLIIQNAGLELAGDCK